MVFGCIDLAMHIVDSPIAHMLYLDTRGTTMKKFISSFSLFLFSTGILLSHEPLLTRAQLEDRIGGALLGSVLGDALGRVTEPLETAEHITQKYGKEGLTSLTQIKSCDWLYEPFKHKVAAYSSNSVLALLMYEVCLQGRKQGLSDQEILMQGACGYMELFGPNNYVLDPHYSFRKHSAITIKSADYLAQYLCQMHDEGKACKKKAPRFQENESSIVPLLWPIGLVFADHYERVRFLVEKQVLITHKHPAVLAASVALAIGIAACVQGEPVEQVVEKMIAAAKWYEQLPRKLGSDEKSTSDMLRDAQKMAPEYKGFTADEAIALAVHIVLAYPDPRQAITEAVNRGGRTALVASLVGALVGAQCGLTRLKEAYETEVHLLENYDRIDAAARDFRSVKKFGGVALPYSFLRTVLSYGALIGTVGCMAYYLYPLIMKDLQS